MRTIALMCVKNEADRYLVDCLKWNRGLVDRFYVFDDYSTDDTVELAMAYGARVGQRGIDEPAFSDNEGLFRQLAWSRMEVDIQPEEGDWIICIDADEFIVGSFDFLSAVEEDAVRLRVHEIFGQDDGVLLRRTDGFWGDIWGVRVGRYKKDLRFKPVILGGGSLPLDLVQGSITSTRASILHLGYMREEDRIAKYERYTKRRGAHASSHIQSILETPKLEPWVGLTPDVRDFSEVRTEANRFALHGGDRYLR